MPVCAVSLPLLGPQAVDSLKALDICAEVLGCLEKRKIPWLVLFQLTETGEVATEDLGTGDGLCLS